MFALEVDLAFRLAVTLKGKFTLVSTSAHRVKLSINDIATTITRL